MKRETMRPLIYFILTVLVGTGVHFLYDGSPNVLFAMLSPVRESVWEHGKLIFWPMLAALLVYTRKDKEQRGGWYLGLLVAQGLLLLFGWVYHIRMEQMSLPVDIAAFVVILGLGFLTALWVPVPPRWKSPLLFGVGVFAILIVVFSFWQPDGLLFADLELADALSVLPC